MAGVLDRYEGFIGWRYLHRGRSSPTLRTVTALSFLLALGTQIAFFVFHHAQLGAILTIPTVLLFTTCLLLNYFSVFTSISIIGVILGVAALTVVLSVTSGFQASFRAKVLGVNAHVLVLKYGLDFAEYREVMKKAKAEPHVKAVAPFVFNEMMLARGSRLSGVLVKGIDPELSPQVLDIGDRLTVGKTSDLEGVATPSDGGTPLPGILIGQELQKKLKAQVGDRLRVVSPKTDFDPSSWSAGGGPAPAVREFRVAGVFYSGFDEYDRRLAYVSLKEAQKFFGPADVVTGVEMKLDDVDRAAEVSRRLLTDLGGTPYRVIDWEELNRNLFTALKMQKVALVIVLTLIILVACFNIVAAMTMLVIDKAKEIAILKSMGMRSAGVARVFLVAGLTIGAVGSVVGLGVGLLICAIVSRYGYSLDPSVYLIDRLPVQVSGSELGLTIVITLGICFIATLYPSLKAANLEPVDGLRYE
jgi:lipoprotein-releasing system permease protein